MKEIQHLLDAIKDGLSVRHLIRGKSFTDEQYQALRAAINDKAVEKLRKLSLETEEELKAIKMYHREYFNTEGRPPAAHHRRAD